MPHIKDRHVLFKYNSLFHFHSDYLIHAEDYKSNIYLVIYCKVQNWAQFFELRPQLPPSGQTQTRSSV